MKATRASGEKAGSTTARGVTARVLGVARSVTVTAGGLDLEEFIRVLEELTGLGAGKVRPRGIALPTFIRMLKRRVKNAKGGDSR